MTRTLLIALCMACTGDLEPVDTDLPIQGAPLVSCDGMLHTAIPSGRSTVSVAGTFNDWTPQRLDDDDGDGIWEIVLPNLEPGTWPYKFLWDDEWETVPDNLPTAWHNGVENRALYVQDCQQPALDVLDARSVDGQIQVDLQWLRAADGSNLESLTATVGALSVDTVIDDSGAIVVQRADLAAGKHSVRVQAVDYLGRRATAFVPLWVAEEPFAWGDGVMYQVFADRFRDGGPSPLADVPDTHVATGYRGGDLVGAKRALDEGYFNDLGVRSLWLSPVYQNPEQAFDGYSGYHGYWPSEPRAVEDRLGTDTISGDDALRDLVDAAHDDGVRVVLDVVLNHVHEQHPYIQEHPEWFDLNGCVCGDPGCEWEEFALTCWFAGYLPDLNYQQPEVVDAMVHDLIWWIETYDVDALRIDAAKHMDHTILRTISARLAQRYEAVGGERIYLIGETFTGVRSQDQIMDYVGDDELDGQFDFPMLWRIRDAVSPTGSLVPLAEEVRLADAAYGKHAQEMSVFLGNHDVARIVSELQGCDVNEAFWGECDDVLAEQRGVGLDGEQADLVGRLGVAWAFVLTQPGPPLVYYGDELGLAGGVDPDNRRDMPWEGLSDAQLAVRDQVQALALARTKSRALRRGARRELWSSDNVYAYARHLDGDAAIVWLAREPSGPTSMYVPVDLFADGTQLRSLLTGATYTVSDSSVLLPTGPWTYDILVP